jgi:hypothetical protein
MRRTPTRSANVLIAVLLGVAACADTTTGTQQPSGVPTPQGGSSPNLAAPFVLGTGQFLGGMGNAEVQRTPGGGGGIGGGAGSPVAAVVSEPPSYCDAIASRARARRRADQSATSRAGTAADERVLHFSRTVDRAQAFVNAGRYGPAVAELECAEQIVLNARTPTQPYEAALRDLATARLASARGDRGTANEAINALKSRLRAPSSS